MKAILTLLLILIVNISFGQNTILDNSRKIIKLDIKTIDIDKFMETLPKGTYYIQKWDGVRVKECKLVKEEKQNIS